MNKLHLMGEHSTGQTMYAYYCPGCQGCHQFTVPRWKWNGSMDKPTVEPSLKMFGDDPALRCHLCITNGNLEFCGDCYHALSGKTVPMPDWDSADDAENTFR